MCSPGAVRLLRLAVIEFKFRVQEVAYLDTKHKHSSPNKSDSIFLKIFFGQWEVKAVQNLYIQLAYSSLS
jgi:hypothetical protein